MIQTYKDLEVYERSYRMAVEMYGITRNYPRDELYGLTSQIKRAATSIPLNIAEGYGKSESAVEFKRFLTMAIGSCNEMQVLIDLSKDLGFLDEERYKRIRDEYDVIVRKLVVLKRNWKQQ